VPIEVVTTGYGRAALEVLRHVVAGAKDGDPLAPVTVVVPSNHVGVSARRLLAGGRLGEVAGGGSGVAAVTFLTTYRLAELLGAAALAGAGRRPVSNPVISAAIRRALADDAGMFAPVAAHAATEAALVATYTELSDVSPGGRAAVAAAGRRARDVVRICEDARALLAADWYDESDLSEAAAGAVAIAGDDRLAREVGHLVVHLPQDLLRRQAALLSALAARVPTTAVVALTGAADADEGVHRSLARLGVTQPPQAAAAPLPVSPATTQIVTTSDADDEVRTAVRRILDAVRDGTPLERIGLLFGTSHPYGRLTHEHLTAAGLPYNGVAVRPLAASTAGRLLLDLLGLPDHDFRSGDVLGLLTRALAGTDGASVAAWERDTRAAGVVAGRTDWDVLLARAAAEHDRAAARSEAAGDERDAPWAERERGRAARVRRLRTSTLHLIDALTEARTADVRGRPAPWAERVAWLRGLVDRLGAAGRDRWPADELHAAEKVDAALERLAALDAVDEPASLDVFRRTLDIELDTDLGRVGRFGQGVLVAPLSFAPGLDLDVVIVLGMAEGSLPAPVRDDALLPDRERRRAEGELALRRERVGREHRRVLAALAAAPRQVLSLPRGDLRVSNERVPSRWLADVATTLAGERVTTDALAALRVPWLEHVPSFAAGVTHTGFPATAQEYRLRSPHGAPDALVDAGTAVLAARRGAAFTRFDGNLADVDVPSPHDTVVSSTRLESWARCPFAYFNQRLLGVDPVDDPEALLEMSPLTRGSLVHEILERFLAEVLARPPERQPAPTQPWTDDDHARIRAIATEVCGEYEAQGITGRPVFWRRDRAQIIALADRFLHEDATERAKGHLRPVAAEYAFGVDPDGAPPVEVALPSGRALSFRGSADRIDERADGSFVVVDYKTGSTRGYEKLTPDEPDRGGTRLQLVVYAFAARARVGAPAARVRSEYWFVSERGGFVRRGYDVDDGVATRVTGTLGTIVAGIERGLFTPHPIEDWGPFVSCPWCDPDGLGVSELRRQWERKRSDPAVAPYADLVEPLDDAVAS
jgi:hypothetical protein